MKLLWKICGVVLCLIGAGRVLAMEDPVVMLNGVTHRVQAELQTHRVEIKNNSESISTIVDHIIIPHVDFDEVSRWVAGRNAWKAASSDAKRDFIDVLKKLIIKSYTHALLTHADKEIAFLPLRGSVDDKSRIQISSLLKEQGKAPIHMDYHLLRTENGWQVYDIIIEGISLVQGYRAQFAESIRDGGVMEATKVIRQHNQG